MWGRLRNRSVESTARRLKDNAARALGSRRYEQAVEYYLALTHIEPDEPLYRMKLGELYLRLQSKQFALDMYRSALELFEKQAAFRKAVATAQMILEIEPEDLDAAHFLNQWRNSVLRPRPLKSALPEQQEAQPVRNSEPTEYYLGEEIEAGGVAVETAAKPVEGPAAADGWGWDGDIEDTWDSAVTPAQLDPPMKAPIFHDGVGSPRTSRRR